MLSDRNILMGEYFKRKVSEISPKYRFKGKTQQDFKLWKTKLLDELKKKLGPMPQPVGLNPEIIHEVKADGLLKRRILIDLEKNMSAVILLYVPQNAFQKPAPAILCCHGHGNYGKDSVMGIRNPFCPQREGEIKQFNYDYGLQMAKHGFVTIAIDWRGFGERSEGDTFDGRDECNVNYLKCALTGYNLLAMDIFDGIRCIDYLCSLDFIDLKNIGCMGLSFGGTMTTWITLLDERIKAADIICYSARFSEFALKTNKFCGSQMFFGLYELCDVPDLHGLIAPRPLLSEVGINDLCFLSDEASSCCDEVKKIYAVAGVSDKYEVDLFQGGHQFAGNKAFNFFEDNLNFRKRKYL
ncbi:MAG: S9 family peptidase [Planctomycetaceae bacterium]|nr:S9 family peptidase [Planctomycetaceae bacterium]